ncbi:hypothetical protein A3K87_04220 [Variovorax paradoxus]|uniref:Uncharacterized protein n=1 Tax=Variovorax paradoxus TaxID=34073 RepID=A0AA91DI43_VARPD|nr:hypothetical protein [Variovorax paradoxus]OAK55011.1 hypothetical protein A3K87_04220 [Variovorax paradoxus]
MNTEFPQLKIERLDNGLIRLEDDSALEACVLLVHPLQVRHMAESLGLVREMSASDADTLAEVRRQHADAVRLVLALKRRLLVLKERVHHLGISLTTAAEHTDLDYELVHVTATAEICDEFCADLDDLVSAAGDDASATPVVARDTAGTTGAAATSDNPAETQRVTNKAPKKSSAPACGQQKDLLA